MKKTDVKIGGHYTAKVSDKIQVVRIDAENPHGGWDATNVGTGKKVRIKSAQRLRAKATKGRGGAWLVGRPKAKPAKKTNVAPRTNAGDAKAESREDATKKTGRNTAQPGATGAKKKELVVGKVTGGPTGSKMSLMAAAVLVLKDAKEPLNTRRIVELVSERGLWEPSRGGKTPANTLYSAILREIRDKGDKSRFEKTERGKFALKS